MNPGWVRMGDWLRDHGLLVRRVQWGVILVYAFLLLVRHGCLA